MGELTGKHILITRAATQTAAVANEIRHRGGIPLCLPCLAVQCLPHHVRKGFGLLKGRDVQALFTSANGVHCAAEAMGDVFTSALRDIPVIAIGRRTASALRGHGVTPAWVPGQASQEGLLAGWRSHGLPRRLVFFRAEEGRDFLPDALAAAAVDVRLVPAYRTVCPHDDADDIIRALKEGNIDAVLLGSARTARHYVQRIGDARLAGRPAVVVISRQVATAAVSMNLDVQVVAKEASFVSMLDGLAAWYRQNKA